MFLRCRLNVAKFFARLCINEEASYKSGACKPARAMEKRMTGLQNLSCATTMKVYYWYVQLTLADALLVLDVDGAVCYLSLGSWPTMVDVVKKEFRVVRNVELLAGNQASKSQAIYSTLQKVHSILDEPFNAHHGADLKFRFFFGTKSQRMIWEFLVGTVTVGETVTYSDISKRLKGVGSPRQIGQACAANRIAVLIPCHRVVSVTSDLTGYKWGMSLKRSLLSSERKAGQT